MMCENKSIVIMMAAYCYCSYARLIAILVCKTACCLHVNNDMQEVTHLKH